MRKRLMKIRIEISGLATAHTSGVGNYTRLLSQALATQSTMHGSYFNFLLRQPDPKIDTTIIRERNIVFPLRAYAKLNSFGYAWPFDIFKRPVDLTIHPNFARWPTIRSKKTATVIHDLTYLYYPELVESKNLAHLHRVVPRAIQGSDFIITVSETVRSEIIKEFGIDPSRCIATPIPPAPEFFVRDDSIDIHTRYAIPTKKYLLFLSNLEPRKNLITLVRAYRLLPKEIRREYSLVIGGGKGWKFEETQAEIDKPLDVGAIRQIGFVDQSDLPSLYQQASLFVMASLYEGFGMPILESLAASTPVLAADVPVLRESGGEAAVYADPKSPEDFAAKIITLLTTGNSVSADAIKHHLAQFSWNKNADIILSASSQL